MGNFCRLSGRPAFPGANIHEILIKNKKGEVLYPNKYWDKITNEAKDLVARMLDKDPKVRITAKEALNHAWFSTSNANGENLRYVSENIANLNNEMVVDYNKIKKEDYGIVTCTPLLGGRQINKMVPESPFLVNDNRMRDNTPMLRVNMLPNGDSSKINVGGVFMNRPGAP